MTKINIAAKNATNALNPPVVATTLIVVAGEFGSSGAVVVFSFEAVILILLFFSAYCSYGISGTIHYCGSSCFLRIIVAS